MKKQLIKKLLTVAITGLCLTLASGCGSKEENKEEVKEEVKTDEAESTNAESTGSAEIYGPLPDTKENQEEKKDINTSGKAKGGDEEETDSEEPEVTESPSEEENTEGGGTLSVPDKKENSSVFGSAEEETEEPETDEKMQTILSQISLPDSNGTWAFYIYDTVNQTEGSYGNARMQAASLIKLYIMGAVYENYDALIGQYGQETIDANLNSMITVSDNDAANALVSYLGNGDSAAGMQTVNDYCSSNGYISTHMGRLLLASNEYDDNYTSVGDCGKFLVKVYEGNASGDTISAAEFALLSAQTRRNKIPANMPDGVSVANKTGELSDVENDAGIIYNSQNDLILVFMSENLTEAGSAQSTIASLSRQIYDYYN